MKKILFLIFASVLIFSTAPLRAADAAAAISEEDFNAVYGSKKEKVPSRPIDNKAAQLAKDYAQKNNGPDPTLGRGGAVVYTYGATMPRILCRPLRVTDIELEPGETVTTPPFVGDSVNWQILPASSGSGANLTMHVMVKPAMPDLATNLIIHTSRRSYHLDLVSSNKHHTPHVAFDYPQQGISNNEWEAFLSGIETQKAGEKANKPYLLPHESAGVTRTENTIISGQKTAQPQTSKIAQLDYCYKIVPNGKNIKWLPAAVYTDNAKTYIQFPQNLKNFEAPVFMAIRNGQRELVNYRVVGNTYVIDAIIDKGVLLAGSGAYSQKIVIAREETSSKSITANPKAVVTKDTDKQPTQPPFSSAPNEAAQTTKQPQPSTQQNLGFPLNIMNGIDRMMQGGRVQEASIRDKKAFTFEDYLLEQKAKKKASAPEPTQQKQTEGQTDQEDVK